MNGAQGVHNCINDCTDRFCKTAPSLCGGYVMGTAPFCGGNANDCTQKLAEQHAGSFGGNVGYGGASVGASGSSSSGVTYQPSITSAPLGTYKEYEDGGAKCWTGTKQCCCWYWQHSLNLAAEHPNVTLPLVRMEVAEGTQDHGIIMGLAEIVSNHSWAVLLVASMVAAFTAGLVVARRSNKSVERYRSWL